MLKITIILLLLVILTIKILVPVAIKTPDIETLTGKVINIIDGDTINLLTNNKKTIVRLASIDAPEKKQSWWENSKHHLSNLIIDKQVVVNYRRKDIYGRIIGTVTYRNININLEMIKAGLAWHYKEHERAFPIAEVTEYAKAQLKVQEEKKGLFSDIKPLEPWNWRKKRKIIMLF